MCLLTKFYKKYYIFEVVYVSYRLSVSKNFLFIVFNILRILFCKCETDAWQRTYHALVSVNGGNINFTFKISSLSWAHVSYRQNSIDRSIIWMHVAASNVPFVFWFIVTWLNVLVNFKQKWLTTYVTFHKENVRDSVSLYTHVINIPIACMCVAKFQKSCTSTVFSTWKIRHFFTIKIS